MLEDGAAVRGAPFRQAAVASVGADGGAEVRTMVLRAADRAARTVHVFTDRRSPKVAELTTEPRCSVLFYDHAAGIQLRLKARAALQRSHEGDAAAQWEALPAGSKICYSQPIAPSMAVCCVRCRCTGSRNGFARRLRELRVGGASHYQYGLAIAVAGGASAGHDMLPSLREPHMARPVILEERP